MSVIEHLSESEALVTWYKSKLSNQIHINRVNFQISINGLSNDSIIDLNTR